MSVLTPKFRIFAVVHITGQTIVSRRFQLQQWHTRRLPTIKLLLLASKAYWRASIMDCGTWVTGKELGPAVCERLAKRDEHGATEEKAVVRGR